MRAKEGPLWVIIVRTKVNGLDEFPKRCDTVGNALAEIKDLDAIVAKVFLLHISSHLKAEFVWSTPQERLKVHELSVGKEEHVTALKIFGMSCMHQHIKGGIGSLVVFKLDTFKALTMVSSNRIVLCEFTSQNGQ